jgi:diguanylate cyclase (GGDEF)-like protein
MNAKRPDPSVGSVWIRSPHFPVRLPLEHLSMRLRFNATAFLGRSSPPTRVAGGVALLLATFAADYWTTRDILLSVLYLFPVSYFAWFFGGRTAVFISVVSAFLWASIDWTKHPPYTGTLVTYWNGLISLGLFLAFVHIIRELKELYVREKQRSHHDSLTGLNNRRSFEESLEAERMRASRYGHPTTIVYLDIDDFKQVNDHFGHGRGDEMLIAIAKTIRRNARVSDVVARLGGDEFAILMPHTPLAAAGTMLRKLQKLIADEMQSHQPAVTCSIGAVTFPQAAESIEEMVSEADALMYSAKKTGKNSLMQAMAAATPLKNII